MRLAIGAVAGLLTAALWVALIQGFGHWLYPPPAGLDSANPEDYAKIIAAVPFEAKLIVVLSWFFGTLAGGVVANGIARQWWTALIIAGSVIFLSAILMLAIPHPLWMQVAGAAAPLIAAELANRITRAWGR